MSLWHIAADGRRFWGPLGAAGLLLLADGEVRRYLLQRRAPWVHHGGTWGIPGGAIEHLEDAEQAAMREASEEGLVLPELQIVGRHVSTPTPGWSYTTLIARPIRSVAFRPAAEVSEHRWATAEEAAGLDLHPGLARSWSTLTRLIDQR